MLFNERQFCNTLQHQPHSQDLNHTREQNITASSLVDSNQKLPAMQISSHSCQPQSLHTHQQLLMSSLENGPRPTRVLAIVHIIHQNNHRLIFMSKKDPLNLSLSSALSIK